MPAAKYLYQFVWLFDSNRLELVRPYLPIAPVPFDNTTLPKARHVLWVIAECLRADRLPSYGYPRITTPFIQSEGSQWLTLDRAYSHGPGTSDNFPVLFNSRDFAAISRGNEGASAL
jgi:glucan phosphoethanolaminetransferase (alkaline phosphatase superfamily)